MGFLKKFKKYIGGEGSIEQENNNNLISEEKMRKASVRKKRYRVASVLACVVAFTTTYALILPAITVEKDDAEEMPGMKVEEKATLDVETLKEGDLLQITPVEGAEGEPHIAIVVETDAESENEASVFVLEKDPEDGVQIVEVSGNDSTVSLLTPEEAAEYESLEEEVLALVQAAGEEELLEPEELKTLEEEVDVSLSKVKELGEDSSVEALNDGEAVSPKDGEIEDQDGGVAVSQGDKSAVAQNTDDVVPGEEAADVTSGEEKDVEQDSSAAHRNDSEAVSQDDSEAAPQNDSFVILSEAKDLAPATETIIDAAMNGRILQQTADGITVTARWEEGVLPEGVEMSVKAVEPTDYKELVDETLGKTRAETQSLDITFRVGDEEVEPTGNVKITFRADFIDRQASPEVVHINADGTAEVMNAKVMNDEITLTATSFSVYVIRYTVDFHWEAAGQVYSYSFQGGSYINVLALVEALGIGEDDPEAFVADIETIEFSNTDLVWAGKAEVDTTVGELKEANGLECQYSAELTEEEIAEINAQPVAAGTWVLISMKPFDTEEYLEVTMKNGDEWILKVTDAKEVQSVNEIDANHSFVILTEQNGQYYVLQTDGTTAVYPNTTNIDKLGNNCRWSFYYVFTEKDRETTLDNVYYFIRPIDDKSRTVALNNEHDALVQKGTNNVAVHKLDGEGFELEGYASQLGNDIFMTLVDGSFEAVHNVEGGSVLKIIRQDPLPTYDFTVYSDDETMGTVSVTNPSSTYERDGVHYYITETDQNKENIQTITATPKTETDAERVAPGVEPHNKYLFDHWELNGVTLYLKDSEGNDLIVNGKRQPVGETIAQSELTIPFNASDLKAVFHINPNYAPAVGEDLGRVVDKESLEKWIIDLETKNLPMNEDGCDKTAEVYDYENRIYRVDLTAEASLWTFAGDIDLGFILDVSGSMQFPSKLFVTEDVDEEKEIKSINNLGAEWIYENYQWRQKTAGEDWGLDTTKDYYIIAKPESTATVCKLFFDGGRWWLCDASKDSTNDANSFYPEDGMRRSDKTKTPTSTYDPNSTFIIYEAGDPVTNEDLADSKKNAILTKLDIATLNTPKNRAFYLESSLNNTLAEMNTMLKVLSIADSSRSKNPDVKIAWNTFKNYLPGEEGQHQYQFLSAKDNTIQLNYDKDTYGGGTSTDIALLDAAGVRRKDVDKDADVNDASDNKPYSKWLTETSQYDDASKYNKNDINSNYSNYTTSGKGFQWNNSATKYAVLITDGAPQRGGKDIDARFVQDAADQLKAKGVTLITLGLSMENVKAGSQLLYNIASVGDDGVKLYYTAKSGDELEYVLYDILRTIMDKAAIQGDVIDTIAPAFYPVEKNTGKPLKDGDMIDLNGNLVTDSNKAHGTIRYSDSTGLYTVEWKNQDMPSDGWHGSVFVKAKEDFLGGNGLCTNYENATIDAQSYTLPGSNEVYLLPSERQQILDSNGNPMTDADGNPIGPYNRHLELETPRVNVNELGFDKNDTEWTVYLGTAVDPKTQLKRLLESINVVEVVNDAVDTDNDVFNIPDKIDYKDATSHHYIIRPNDLTDNREKIAGEASGTNASFKMQDLIIELIQDCISKGDSSRMDWDSFITIGANGKPELRWDYFLAEALKQDGITIPYNKYGLDDVAHKLKGADGQPVQHYDNSSINIKISKEIVEGEEADFVNNSPHATTVVNKTEIVEKEDGIQETIVNPVEKYTLDILYSPDYDVLPEGQGGNSIEDFHVGVYGAMYQGHAAGTETSTNEHVINVYAEPLDIEKVDDYGDPVEGAEFKLYRIVNSSNQEEVNKQESLSSYNSALTGSYYCISSAASGLDGVAHLAPGKENLDGHTIPVADGETGQNLLVPLEAGETYYLVETKAPIGYQSDNTVRTIRAQVGPELFTKLDKTTPVESSDILGTPARPVVPYNWEEGVTFMVGTLGQNGEVLEETPAEMVNHETRVKYSPDRTYMLASDSSNLAVFDIRVLNSIVTDISILKVDSTSEGSTGLTGAVFQLKRVNGSEESYVEGVEGLGTITKEVGGETKTFNSAFETGTTVQTLQNLPDGIYRLYEVITPPGYNRSFDYVGFKMENHLMKDVTTEHGVDSTVVKVDPATDNTLALITISNTPGAVLPETGGPGQEGILAIGGLLVISAAAGLILRQRKLLKHDR